MFTYYRLIYEEANPKTAIICSSISGIRARVAMGLSKGYYSFMSISDYFDDSAEMDRFLCYIESNHDEPEALAEELLNDVRVIRGLKGDNRKSGYVQKMRELRRKIKSLSPRQSESLGIYLKTYKPTAEDVPVKLSILAVIISACCFSLSSLEFLNDNSDDIKVKFELSATSNNAYATIKNTHAAGITAPFVLYVAACIICLVLVFSVMWGYYKSCFRDYELLSELLSLNKSPAF